MSDLMRERVRLVKADRNTEPALIVGREERTDLGWCMVVAKGTAPTLTCRRCAERVTWGYMPRSGGDMRCSECVVFIDKARPRDPDEPNPRLLVTMEPKER